MVFWGAGKGCVVRGLWAGWKMISARGKWDGSEECGARSEAWELRIWDFGWLNGRERREKGRREIVTLRGRAAEKGRWAGLAGLSGGVWVAGAVVGEREKEVGRCAAAVGICGPASPMD